MTGFFKSIANLFKRGSRAKRADYSALYDEHQASGSSVYPREPRRADKRLDTKQLHGPKGKGGRGILGALKRGRSARRATFDDEVRVAATEEPQTIAVGPGGQNAVEAECIHRSNSRLVAGEGKDNVTNPRNAASASKPPRPPKSPARQSGVSKEKVAKYPAPNITIVREECTDSYNLEHTNDPSSAKSPFRRPKKRPRIWKKPVPELVPRSIIRAHTPPNTELTPLEETEETGVLMNGAAVPSFPSVKVGDGVWDIDRHTPKTEVVPQTTAFEDPQPEQSSCTEPTETRNAEGDPTALIDFSSVPQARKAGLVPPEVTSKGSSEDQASFTEPTETGNTEGGTTAITDLFPTPLSIQATLTDAECHSLPPREVFIYDDSQGSDDDASSLKGLFDSAEVCEEQVGKESGCVLGISPRHDTVYSTEESVVVPVTAMQLQMDMAQVQYVPPPTPIGATQAPETPVHEIADVDDQDDEEPTLKTIVPPLTGQEAHATPFGDLGMDHPSGLQVLQCLSCGSKEVPHDCMYSEEQSLLGNNQLPPVASLVVEALGTAPYNIAPPDLDASAEPPSLSPSTGLILTSASRVPLPEIVGEHTARSSDGNTQESTEPNHDASPDVPGKQGWIYHELPTGIRVDIASTVRLEERPTWAEGKLRIQSAASALLDGNRTMENWDDLLEAFETPPFNWVRNPVNVSDAELDFMLEYADTTIGTLIALLLEIQDIRQPGATSSHHGLWSRFHEEFEALGWTNEKPRRLRDLMDAVECELFSSATSSNIDEEAMDVHPTPEVCTDPWLQYPTLDDDARINTFMSAIEMPAVPGHPDLIPTVIRNILKCTRRLMLEERTTPLWDDLLHSFQGLRWLDDPPDPKMRELVRSSVAQFEIDVMRILVLSGSEFALVLDLIISVHRHAHLGEVHPDLVQKMEALGWNPATPQLFRDLLARKRILEPVDPQLPSDPSMDTDRIRIPGCSMTFTVAASHSGGHYLPTAVTVAADSTVEQFREAFGRQFGPEVWEALTVDIVLKLLAQLMKRDYPYPVYLRDTPASRLLDLAAEGLVTTEDLAKGWVKDPQQERRFEYVDSSVGTDGDEACSLTRRSTLARSIGPSGTDAKHPMRRAQNMKKRDRRGPRNGRVAG